MRSWFSFTEFSSWDHGGAGRSSQGLKSESTAHTGQNLELPQRGIMTSNNCMGHALPNTILSVEVITLGNIPLTKHLVKMVNVVLSL